MIGSENASRHRHVLISASLLTLYPTPVVYLAFDWLGRRFAFHVAIHRRAGHRRLASGTFLKLLRALHPTACCHVADYYCDFSLRELSRFVFCRLHRFAS